MHYSQAHRQHEDAPMIRYAAAALFIPLAACATGGDTPRADSFADLAEDPRLGEELNRACFASSVRNFSNNTRDSVVLEASRNRQFVVEVFGTCQNLKFAQTVGLHTATGCVTKGDRLLVGTSAGGFRSTGRGSQRCTIKSLYEWNADAEATEDDAPDSETEA